MLPHASLHRSCVCERMVFRLLLNAQVIEDYKEKLQLRTDHHMG